MADLDDLDAELLGLGGDEDEDVKSIVSSVMSDDDAPKIPRKRASPLPSSSQTPKKRVKPSTKKSSKRRRRGSDDEDNDDGDNLSQYSDEMSVSNGSDLSEADMIQSEDDSDYEIQSKYPLEGIYKDEKDKDWLEDLPEIEREGILADRANEIEKERGNRQLAQVHKRKMQEQATIARRSTRTKSAPQKSGERKKNDKLSELVKKRKEMSNRKASNAAGIDRAKKRRRSDGSGSLSSGEEQEEEEEDEEPVWAKYDEPKKQREVGLDDFNKLRLGRNEIVRFWHYPNFEDVATGCYIRFSLGPDQETGQPVYRICQIRKFEPSERVYELSSRGNSTKINRKVVIAIGESERATRMDVISDSQFTDDELRWYRGALDAAGMSSPTAYQIDNKFDAIRGLISKKHSDAEITEMLKRRQEINPNAVSAAIRIKSLRQQREFALSQGDDQDLLRLDLEIGQLESVSQAPPRSLLNREETQMQRLARINRENRKTNMHEIRKAELEEKRRNALAARAAATNGANASGFLDPFSRVKTRAKIYHDKPADVETGKPVDTEMEDLFGSDATSREGSALPPTAASAKPSPAPRSSLSEVKTSAPLSTGKKKKTGVDDVIANMGFTIEI